MRARRTLRTPRVTQHAAATAAAVTPSMNEVDVTFATRAPRLDFLCKRRGTGEEETAGGSM